MTAARAPARTLSRVLPALGRAFQLRPGEGRLVLLLSLAAFALITSYYFLKPVAKSIFLQEHSAGDLRWVYLATGPVAALVGIAHARVAGRFRLVPTVNWVLATLALLLVGFRLALGVPGLRGPLAYALSLFQQEFGVLAMALLYLVVNHLLEPRQARRLLGFIGSGAILGGMTGGYLVSLTVSRVGTEGLLWGAVAILGLAALALNLVFLGVARPGRPRPEPRFRTTSTLRLIAAQPYLRQLVALIALVMLCATLVDYQFNWAVQEHVPAGDATTAYLGFWFSTISAISLPIQLLLTTPLLSRAGVGPALLLLPCTVLVLGAGMAAVPGLLLGTALKVGDGALRYSVNKSAVEALYLPLPLWLKDRTKVFIDTALDRLAKSGAGLLLVLVLDLFRLGVRGTGALTAMLAAGWIAWALSMRQRHVAAFRSALDRGAVDADSATVHLQDPRVITTLLQALHAASPQRVRQALDLLRAAPATDLRLVSERLAELGASPDPELAVAALELGAQRPDASLVTVATGRLNDDDPRVGRAAAGLLLADEAAGGAQVSASAAAGGERGRLHLAAARLDAGVDPGDALIESFLAGESPAAAEARAALAQALGRGALPARRQLLRRLLADPEPPVAIAALEGAGELGDLELLPFLVSALRRAATRPAARRALTRLGRPVVARLAELLADPRVEHAVRRRLPRAIAQVGGPESRAALVSALNEEDPRLRHQVLRTLARLAEHEGRSPLPPELIESELLAECLALARLLGLVARPGEPGPCRALFERAVNEAVSDARERILRLLGLRGVARDWTNALAGLSSSDPRRRATAVEFADGSLPDRLRHLVVPLIDDIGAAEAIHRVSRRLDVVPLRPSAAYLQAAAGADRWLAACAFFAGAEAGCAELIAVASSRRSDPDPLVAEAAQTALAWLGAEGADSVGSEGRPSTGSEGKPSTGSEGRPSTGSEGRPSTGSEGRPSTGR